MSSPSASPRLSEQSSPSASPPCQSTSDVRPPRPSTFSIETEERLALSHSSSDQLLHAQTTTLRMLQGSGSAQTGLLQQRAELPESALAALSEAEASFKPDMTAMASPLERMESKLLSLMSQRETLVAATHTSRDSGAVSP